MKTGKSEAEIVSPQTDEGVMVEGRRRKKNRKITGIRGKGINW